MCFRVNCSIVVPLRRPTAVDVPVRPWSSLVKLIETASVGSATWRSELNQNPFHWNTALDFPFDIVT